MKRIRSFWEWVRAELALAEIAFWDSPDGRVVIESTAGAEPTYGFAKKSDPKSADR